MKCMFVPLKYTDCTLVMHPLHYGTYCSLHQMLTEQAAGCVLTSPPRSVMSKAIFRSVVNALHSYLIFCFALDFHSLCPHTLQHWVLALYGNYHVPGIHTCTNETTTCIDYSRNTLRWFVVKENASPLQVRIYVLPHASRSLP